MRVELYEDNAGHLFLVHGDKVWSELEQTGGTFSEDARAILRDDTGDWTVPVYSRENINIISTGQLIASYQEDSIMSLRMHSRPGMAASQYIIGERNNLKWVPRGDQMWVYRGNEPATVYPFEGMV